LRPSRQRPNTQEDGRCQEKEAGFRGFHYE
jgi:hypothetical protein